MEIAEGKNCHETKTCYVKANIVYGNSSLIPTGLGHEKTIWIYIS